MLKKVISITIVAAVSCFLLLGCSTGKEGDNVFDKLATNGMRTLHEHTDSSFTGNYSKDGRYGLAVKQQTNTHAADENHHEFSLETTADGDYRLTFEWADLYRLSGDEALAVVYESVYRQRTKMLVVCQPRYYSLSNEGCEKFSEKGMVLLSKGSEVGFEIEDTPEALDLLSSLGISESTVNENRLSPSTFFADLYLSITEEGYSGNADDWGTYRQTLL